MDRISSTSIIPSQAIQKGLRELFAMTHTWVLVVVAAVLLLPLIFTGLICVAIPLVGFGVLMYHAYEIRFKNPVSDVWIDRDHLLMERRGESERIHLGDVRSLNLSTYNNPPYCVMELNVPCRWGDTVTWFPSRLSSFGEMPTLIKELQKRIDRARDDQTR
ncbi:hypothetical protein SAMN06265222_12722 [Neorhodopirellula lusitana]|uniref:DUF304 domain-containing protein n=2 Tax=Neorhodopirellula lusitana TaxID=445327 RepID=A0ABY1QRE1_9BACT|nr:hypothetical protein SAMN06265222_12722 [Neorhodopirellula lusitana]